MSKRIRLLFSMLYEAALGWWLDGVRWEHPSGKGSRMTLKNGVAFAYPRDEEGDPDCWFDWTGDTPSSLLRQEKAGYLRRLSPAPTPQ